MSYLYHRGEPAGVANVLEPNRGIPPPLSLMGIQRIIGGIGHTKPFHVPTVIHQTGFKGSGEEGKKHKILISISIIF